MSEAFYLRDSRSDTGSNMMFWAEGGSYTSDLSRAEVFTRKGAFAQHECRETDIPMPKALVDARARFVVDMQLLRRERDTALASDRFYVQIEHEYDGNDVTWVAQAGGSTTDLSLASEWYGNEAMAAVIRNDGWRAWPKDFIDGLRRPAAKAMHAKQIIREAGIVLRKPKRQRKESYRCHHCGIFLTVHDYYGNCPRCGGENRP